MRIYFAGPLFTTGEREFNSRVADGLRTRGYDVWLPQESEQREVSVGAIFLTDVEGIDWCDVVLGCMDGADPDSGTCWECGSVFRRKPVVLYRTDIREESPPFGPYNLMLHQAAVNVVDCKWCDSQEVIKRICAALERLPAPA